MDHALLTLREATGGELGKSGSRWDLAPQDPLQGQGMALPTWTDPTKQQCEGHRIGRHLGMPLGRLQGHPRDMDTILSHPYPSHGCKAPE